MAIVTVYVLFVDDIWVLSIPKKMDEVFMALNVISLVLFSLEIILSSISIKGYFFMFYFWLDLIATLSLISDITWIWYKIVGINDDLQNSFDNNGTVDPSALIGRKNNTTASRVARLMKIIRLIRLIRIVKLYKFAQSALNSNQK